MSVSGDSVIIDTQGLANSNGEMMYHDSLVSPKSCIFKIPNILSRQNENAFTPDAFSFGPLHHEDPNLKAVEKIKLQYLQCLISRLRTSEIDLIKSIDGVLETKARQYYAESIKYTPEEFVKILLIDGCFIIELFRKDAYKELREKDDPIFTMSCMLQFLYHDLILLENQVPWIVLEHLFNMTKQQTHTQSLLELGIQFFGTTFSATPPTKILPLKDIKHIVDLLRKWLVSSTIEEKSNSEYWEVMPSATGLMEAGIKFVKGTSESILDIKFNDGILKIPPLLIQETTETAFRNLIAFEQCYTDCEAWLTSYAILIDNLINTTKDVDILCESEIIHSWSNRKEAVQFFNKLYHNTYVKTFYYGKLCNNVNGYCNRRWPRWRAVLVRNYFNTPWALLSTLAAIILLILSFLQTLYTMKSYYRGHDDS
ncbi:hypothetical protein F2P56_012356 [Juglans regia]|uniref:Uncharacterized protein n=2 Tax=Juglans regia TaxID=51240 RepID=A0A833XMZ3_JUGRE|nr:UPF0481 protein At3g47200-like [Juglans regia]XP_018824958.2 UPF0481 protein At3g47200-like [Juglans regia]KAF5468179.1 hypothetical protein F2P56_012355 [Juglans regia]KAF5468180.1 hypothetical protein F2P56_012356 [Juglans regia]